MMPPPGYMMPPPRRERSFARAIFTTLATTIFGLSIVLNIYLLAISGMMSARSSAGLAEEVTIEEGDLTQKIAVVRVSGTIMEGAATEFRTVMDRVEKDPNVKALVVEIDTPGGGVTASDEIFHRIEQFKARKSGVQVVASMQALATSGGYYVACAADYVIAQPTTLTGNIGVIMPSLNFAKLIDKWGIEDTTVASTGATFKDAGSPFKSPNEIDRKYIQALADSAFATFKDRVVAGRGTRLTKGIDEIANGKVYTAKEAKTLGLVDQIGYSPDAYDQAAKMAGLSSRRSVVRFHRQMSLLEQVFSAKSNVTGAQANGAGINVNVDAASVQEWMTPRMMYLWTGN